MWHSSYAVSLGPSTYMSECLVRPDYFRSACPGAGRVPGDGSELPPAMLTARISARLKSPRCSAFIQLPAKEFGKVAEGSPSPWISASHVGDQLAFQVPGFHLAQSWPFLPFVSELVKEVSLSLPFSHCVSQLNKINLFKAVFLFFFF